MCAKEYTDIIDFINLILDVYNSQLNLLGR